MSCESPNKPDLEQLYPYKIREAPPHPVSAKDSYDLPLLGFVHEIPMLTIETQATAASSAPQPAIVEPSKVPASLQGKKVIVKTNCMSGEKSLIFKQKTGEKVEIPATRCSFLKPSDTTVENVGHSLKVLEPVGPKRAPVALPPVQEPVAAPRHKPTILRRKGRLRYQIIAKDKATYFNLVNSKTTNVAGNVSKQKADSSTKLEGHLQAKLLPSGHDYLVSKDTTPRDVKKTPAEVQVVNTVKFGDVLNSCVKLVVAENAPPLKTYQRIKPKTSSMETYTKKQPRYEVVNKGKKRTVNSQVTQIRSDIENGKLTENKNDLGGNKGTFLVMIANQQLVDQPQLPDTKVKPSVKAPSMPPRKRVQKVDQSVQTAENPVKTQDMETNTDDSLLQDFINRRIQEKAVQQPNPVSLEFVPPNCDDQIAQKLDPMSFGAPSDLSCCNDRIAPSPCSLMNDSDLIRDLWSFCDEPSSRYGVPIIGSNPCFGTGPVMGGKCIESVVNGGRPEFTDISYSRGKNISNCNWGANIMVQNGRRPHIEPWRIQFFLDLKHCNQFDSYGNMPLHVAVMENNFKLVRRQCFALRVRSINVDTFNHNSLTALQLALLHDANVPILQTLISHKANTSVLDAEGNTVLHLAVMHSSDEIVQMLLGTCSSLAVDASNFEGDTALIICVLHKKYVKADKILQAGANPNIGDKKSGRTPLFHAVEANDVEMVKILLNYKAQTKVRNFFGTSPHDAMFELDSIDKTIRKLVLNKDYPPYRNKPEGKEKRKRKESNERSPNAKNVKVKTERTLEKVGRRKS